MIADSRGYAARLALAAILILAAWHAWHRAFLIDDAYISFRYARNLLEGHGLVYNIGDRVEGYTNFLWTLIIAGAMRLGADPGIAAQLFGIASSIGVLLVLHRWGRDLGAPAWGALLAPAMLAVNRSFAAWATGGLETRLFTFLIVAAAWRLHREIRTLRADAGAESSSSLDGLPLSAALISLACLTRPEGYLALAVAGGGIACLLTRIPAARRRAGWGAGSYIYMWAAAALAFPVAHLLWRHGYYDAWLPNSFYAKVPGFRLMSGGVYLWAFARREMAVAIVFVPLLFLPRRAPSPITRLGPALGPFTLPFAAAYLLYVFAVGGDHFEFRFVDPVLTLIYFAGAMASLSAIALRRQILVALVGLSALSSFFPPGDLDVYPELGGESTYVSISTVETESGYLSRWERIGRWLKDHAGADESIAVTPAGAIPYFSGLRTLDMLGINDHDVARLPPRPGRNVGHEKRVEADYAIARGITYLIADPEIRTERAREIPPNAVEVSFGDFWWYFWTLQPGARIPPGSFNARERPRDPDR